MKSVSITELIRQAKTSDKSNQVVGNLRFVVFQHFAIPIYSVNRVILHSLRLPLDVNSL